MITTNVSGITDDWSNYFSSQVGSYKPASMVAKPWSKPKKLKKVRPGIPIHCHTPHLHPVSIEVSKKKNCGCHNHIHIQLPCFNQHKPYGIATVNLQKPYDDDRPDWHEFDSANRQPKMYEEVIDDCGCVHECHPGVIAVRPVAPVINKSDEIEEEVTL